MCRNVQTSEEKMDVFKKYLFNLSDKFIIALAK